MMTLKEKFEQWFINDEEDEHYEGMVDLVSIEHEKIAEDFAIGFAEWLLRFDNLKNESKYIIEQLLKIYKEETGL